jgi:hypothetical protein
MQQIERLASAEAQYDVISWPLDAIARQMLRAVLNERDAALFAESCQFSRSVANSEEVDGNDRHRIGRQAGLKSTKIVAPA